MMHTQTETATQITASGANDTLTVKGNQKSLYQACNAFTGKPSHPRQHPEYARLQAHRAIKATSVPAWITFLAQFRSPRSA